MKYEFFTVPQPSARSVEYRWKWRDSEHADESTEAFESLRSCIDDARRHGFLDGAGGEPSPGESQRLR